MAESSNDRGVAITTRPINDLLTLVGLSEGTQQLSVLLFPQGQISVFSVTPREISDNLARALGRIAVAHSADAVEPHGSRWIRRTIGGAEADTAVRVTPDALQPMAKVACLDPNPTDETLTLIGKTLVELPQERAKR